MLRVNLFPLHDLKFLMTLSSRMRWPRTNHLQVIEIMSLRFHLPKWTSLHRHHEVVARLRVLDDQ